MSFPEFVCTAKATGKRYVFVNKVVTFFNITHNIDQTVRILVA